MAEDLLRIGEVADRYDVSMQTLRYYEKLGILNSARQSNSVYRYYDEKGRKTLERILLRHMGFSLRKIGTILDERNPDPLQKILRAKKKETNQHKRKLEHLTDNLRRVLQRLSTCTSALLTSGLHIQRREITARWDEEMMRWTF